jgi:hypothetical protein
MPAAPKHLGQWFQFSLGTILVLLLTVVGI